jgi:hypothetical protein
VECLFAKVEIPKNAKVSEEMFYLGKIDIKTVATTRIIKDFHEIENQYANETIYKGQLAVADAFNTKEKLAIYETEKDKEKIAIKIKSPENGASYRMLPGTRVNVYATLRSDLTHGFLEGKERLRIGQEEGFEVIKILENQEVLDTFDIDGYRMNESESPMIDTILLAVSHDEAKEINLLREVANFNVTITGSSIEEP